MFEKISLEKVALLTIPYLLLLSICYNSGYWDVFGFSVFNYYEAQDILKDIAGPLFKFSGLVLTPIFILLVIVISWARNINSNKNLAKEQRLAEQYERYGIDQAEEKCSAPIEVQQAHTPEPEKWSTKFFRFIALGIIAIIASLFLLAIFYTIVFYLFPYEDEGDFLLIYIKSLDSTVIQRFFVLLLLPSILVASIAHGMQLIEAKDRFKVLSIISSFILTLLISYHYGRIDASKVTSGAQFRFWIDPRGHGHKYLAKINKNYFFLDDTMFINTSGNMNYRLDTLIISPVVDIITDDSLKSATLDYYGPRTARMAPDFTKRFASRNGGESF